MDDSRPWYRHPDIFIAAAALIVSITAVVVGVYEAALQRRHDRAEVWPNLQVATFLEGPNGARVLLENTGVGPAIVMPTAVTVDGKPQRTWAAVARALGDTATGIDATSTVTGYSLRAGDHSVLMGLPAAALGHPFFSWIGRVALRICYRSVFDDHWLLDARLGAFSRSTAVASCPAQADSTDL